MRISRSPTWPTARACEVLRPEMATVTSRSMISPSLAKLRYCAVAHTAGRPHTASMADTAAPSPHPPNRNWPPVMMSSVTGRNHRVGLWVGCRPRNSAASIAGRIPAAHRSPILPAPGDQRGGHHMTDAPWQGDACSLVEAFRGGERSPAEELEATLAAVGSSTLNAFSFVDPERALAKAAVADVDRPFGGVPFAVKELSNYEGWPATEACTLFRDRLATHTDTKLVRAERDGGVVPFGLTTASEFGGLNVSITKLNGVTHNPWRHGRTAGGSSGGSSAAVAGGLCTIAGGGDGGGSIRIPAGFNGLPGMKGTAGRIPRGPNTWIHPMTVVSGVMARSIRDIARFYDVAAGYDSRDPYSLPKVDSWEADLGSYREELQGRKVAIVADLGVAVVHPAVAERVREAGAELARAAGLQVVDLDVRFPGLGLEWAIGNLSGLLAELGDLWPDARHELTPEIAFGLEMAEQMVNLSTNAKGEQARTRANETVAEAFDRVDFIISATNPDVAFPAEVSLNTRVGDERVGPENNGALTIPYNIVGNPSLSLPVGLVDGLPVGMQVAALHHRDAWLLDLGLLWETVQPWPLVAPGAPV